MPDKKPIKQELEALERLVSETPGQPIKESLEDLESETKLPEEPEKSAEREEQIKKAFENFSDPVLRALTLGYLAIHDVRIFDYPMFDSYQGASIQDIVLDRALTLANSNKGKKYSKQTAPVEHEFKHFPDVYSDKGGQKVASSMLDYENGPITGTKIKLTRGPKRDIPENFYLTLKRAAAVLDRAIDYLTVQDALRLEGSTATVKKRYRNKLISELPEKEAKELITSYMKIFVVRETAKAFKRSEEDMPSFLNKFLKDPQTQKE